MMDADDVLITGAPSVSHNPDSESPVSHNAPREAGDGEMASMRNAAVKMANEVQGYLSAMQFLSVPAPLVLWLDEELGRSRSREEALRECLKGLVEEYDVTRATGGVIMTRIYDSMQGWEPKGYAVTSDGGKLWATALSLLTPASGPTTATPEGKE